MVHVNIWFPQYSWHWQSKCLWKVSMKDKCDWIYMNSQTWTSFQTLPLSPVLFAVLWKRELSEYADLGEQLNQELRKFSNFLETSTSKIYFNFCSEVQMCSNFLWNLNSKLNTLCYNIYFFLIIFNIFAYVLYCITLCTTTDLSRNTEVKQ